MKTKKQQKKKMAARGRRRRRNVVDVEAMISAMNLNLVRGRWYGFDIDGTIADNTRHGWEIDGPIRPMVALMKWLHAKGYDVRILSGRTGDYYSDEEIPAGVRAHIWSWCDRHLGFRPTLTGRKTSSMEALFDDRAKQVVCNRGETYEALARELARALDGAIQSPVKDMKGISALIRKCYDYGVL